MLLLTGDGEKRTLLLIEARTISNNAWYAAVENLRQLRLFQASDTARRIMQRRHPDTLPDPTPVTGVVLAPAAFYAAPGAKNRSIAPTLQMIDRLGLGIRLAIWDGKARAITELASDE